MKLQSKNLNCDGLTESQTTSFFGGRKSYPVSIWENSIHNLHVWLWDGAEYNPYIFPLQLSQHLNSHTVQFLLHLASILYILSVKKNKVWFMASFSSWTIKQVYRLLEDSLNILAIYSVSNIRSWLQSVGPASVAQLDAPSDWRLEGHGFNPHRGRQHSFVEIDHEIFSRVILSLPLIQEGQLSVSGERMCTILVNRLED